MVYKAVYEKGYPVNGLYLPMDNLFGFCEINASSVWVSRCVQLGNCYLFLLFTFSEFSKNVEPHGGEFGNLDLIINILVCCVFSHFRKVYSP